MLALQSSDEQFEKFLKKTRAPGFFKDPRADNDLTASIAPPTLPERSISARVFPNGEFGVGFVPRRGISAKDRRYERDCRYARENAEIVPDVQISPDGEQFTYGRKIIPGFPSPKLGIGADLSQSKRKYGLKGITSHGRKMLRNAGHIFDVVAASGRGYLPQMGTLTIPSLEPERMKIIAEKWNDIIRRFFQECRRRYLRFGKVFDYAGCTEIQPERWENRREVGLHFHFLFVAFRINKKVWSLPDEWVRRIWRRTLVCYVGETGVPNNLNYRRETVRRSSAGYIAKYASKGAEFVEAVAREMGAEYLPSRWWSMNSRLRDAILKHTISSQGTVAEVLLTICTEDMQEYLKYKREVVLYTNINDYAREHNAPEAILLGYGGMLSASGFGLFTNEDYYRSIKGYMSLAVDR